MARLLDTDESNSASVEGLFSFSAPCAKKKVPRKNSTPIVDSAVRRCTRGSMKWDGFKPLLQELPMPMPKKRKPRAKPLEVPADNKEATPSVEEEPSNDIPSAMPVRVIQAVV
ncbi:hypothetical protein D1007_37018 [Hordeum vulgare]|nr:hypothetical protein D1007_37018 [Hordeum vulgare]